jgi:hypothetical protein
VENVQAAQERSKDKTCKSVTKKQFDKKDTRCFKSGQGGNFRTLQSCSSYYMLRDIPLFLGIQGYLGIILLFSR